MQDLEAKFRVRVDGKDELENFFSGGERSAKSFEKNIKAALAETGRSITGFVSGLAKDLMRVSGLKLGLAANARGALEFRDALEQLAVSAGIGDDKIGGLKKQILDTATASNQMKDDVTDALQAFVEKTGDIETARKNLALYAETATATRAKLKDVALVGVEMKDKLGITDQKGAFSALVAQSKKGAIELKDMAAYAPRVLSAAAAGGLKGEGGLREAGALTQVYAKAFGGHGGAAMGSTALENTFGDIMAHAGKIEKMGIQVRGRDQAQVLLDIIRKTGGDPIALQEIFKRRAIRGVNILANEYRATGRFDTYEGFRTAGGDYSVIQSDAQRQQSTGIAALKRSQIAIERSSEEHLGNSAELLAKHSDVISSGYEFATGHPLAAGGLATAGVFAAAYAKRALLGGGGGVGGGGLLGGGGATPVRVTNWPASMGGPGDLGGGGKLGIAAKAIPLIGTAYAVQEGLAAVLGEVPTGGGLKVGDASDSFGNFNKKKLGGSVNANKAALFNKFMEQNEAAAAAAGKPIENHIRIEIHGDQATVTEDNGTRSNVALERRNGGEP